MGSVPVPKPREVVALLEAHGFAEVRQRGSQKQVRYADGRCTTVPFHVGRDISPPLVREIARAAAGLCRVVPVSRVDGHLITPAQIADAVGQPEGATIP